MGEHLSRECLIPLKCACACNCMYLRDTKATSYVRVSGKRREGIALCESFLRFSRYYEPGHLRLSFRHAATTCNVRKERSCSEKIEKMAKKDSGISAKVFSTCITIHPRFCAVAEISSCSRYADSG